MTVAMAPGTRIGPYAVTTQIGEGGGWLLWVRAGTLVAQPLDVATAALTGEPVTLAEAVAVGTSGQSAVSVAATGLVAYRTGGSSPRQLTWVDRSGTARGTIGEPDSSLYGGADRRGGDRARTRRAGDALPHARFLINTELPGNAAPLTLIQHWNPDAKQ